MQGTEGSRILGSRELRPLPLPPLPLLPRGVMGSPGSAQMVEGSFQGSK